MTGKPRRERRRLDGVLLLDKPAGMTSNAALQATRRLFGALKAGHTGTLDPLATGLLPLCFGEATKFAHALLNADKRYRARVELGVRTDSGDAEGKVIARGAVDVDAAALAAALQRFRGEISQVPPMHSALKRDGRPLYELARQGITVAREPRRVCIHELVLLAFAGQHLDLEVHCSKGTYIRALADDLGQALGCGAHLAALRRIGIGGFDLSRACTLEQLEALPAYERDARLLPADALVADLPRIDLDPIRSRSLLHGQALDGGATAAAEVMRAYDEGGRFLGLVRSGADGRLVALRLVATGEAGDPALPCSCET